MATETTITPPTASPQHTSPANRTQAHTPESHAATSNSPVQTPASSPPSTLHSLGMNGGKRPPPNSVSGVAPYGAYQRGVSESELPFIPYEYEHVWRDPGTTPQTRSAAASPPPSPTPREVPADTLANLLATIPEGLEPTPTPRYLPSSKFTRAETVTTDSTTLSEGGNVLHFNCKPRNSRIPDQNVEFLTASGVLEYSTWDCLASEDMENSLKRAKQLAVDTNRLDPRKSVEQYYNEFVGKQLCNPEINIKFTPHGVCETDAPLAELRTVEARLEDLTRQVTELRLENTLMKQEIGKMSHKADQVGVMLKEAEGMNC